MSNRSWLVIFLVTLVAGFALLAYRSKEQQTAEMADPVVRERAPRRNNVGTGGGMPQPREDRVYFAPPPTPPRPTGKPDPRDTDRPSELPESRAREAVNDDFPDDVPPFEPTGDPPEPPSDFIPPEVPGVPDPYEDLNPAYEGQPLDSDLNPIPPDIPPPPEAFGRDAVQEGLEDALQGGGGEEDFGEGSGDYYDDGGF